MATEAKTKPPPEPAPTIYTKNLVRAPGPGKYDLPSEFGPGKKGAYRWSMAGKPRSRRDEVTPGPDKYSHPRSSFGGTKYSMGARFVYRDKDDSVPVPVKDGKAVVEQKVRSSIGLGPKFSMGGRTRPVRADMTPDPTKYNPLAALKFTTQKVPAFSMAAKHRTLDRDPYAPRVAAAQDGKAVIPPSVKSLIGTGGPKFSMPGRTRRPREDVMPGPGMYPGANQSTVGKNNGPSYSMSARVKKGIQYGHWGDEPRLGQSVSARLPAISNAVVHST